MGALLPSIGVFLTGVDPPDAEQRPCLAWEGDGSMRWGELIPTPPRRARRHGDRSDQNGMSLPSTPWAG
jgi:hypothetical protein